MDCTAREAIAVHWFKISNQFARHPKAARAGADALALWMAGGCHVAEFETDGFIDAAVLPELPFYSPGRLQALLDAGLWLQVEGGYQVHDWAAWNITKEQARAQREKTKARVSKHRSGNAVTAPLQPPLPPVPIYGEAPPTATHPRAGVSSSLSMDQESQTLLVGITHPDSPVPPTPDLSTPRARGLKKRAKDPAPTSATWDAYAAAYAERYAGHQPKRNATVNGQLANLVARLGAEDAPQVAAFYLTHNAARYTTAGHRVGLLLQDAEKLHMEWATGQQINATTAKRNEQTQANPFLKLAREAEERERREREGSK